jgi:thioredoxin 1
MAVEPIDGQKFDEAVMKSRSPVVIDFWAEWCGPCRAFSPIIEEVSKDFEGKVKFAKLNVDENQDLASKYNVMGIPTVIMFKDGKVKATSVGVVPKDTLKKWVEANLG